MIERILLETFKAKLISNGHYKCTVNAVVDREVVELSFEVNDSRIKCEMTSESYNYAQVNSGSLTWPLEFMTEERVGALMVMKKMAPISK